MSLRIVGVNLSHDSSVCLLVDGRIRAALALERTTRVKRGVVAAHSYAAAMAHLIMDVLRSEGLDAVDIDYWIATSTESRDAADEAVLADALGLVAPPDRRLVLPHPGHHLAHAAAAFYTSGFDEAAAVVVDAYGSRVDDGRERESAFLFTTGQGPQRIMSYRRDDHRIAGRLQAGYLRIPDQLSGIGEVYRVVTLALGFRESGTTYDDAGKTMGLAPYGNRLSEANLFIESGPGGITFDRAGESLLALGLAERGEKGLLLCPRPPGAPLVQFHADLAAQIQSEFEAAGLHLVQTVLDRAGTTSLVLSGGCFLNSVLNTRIAKELGVNRMFVFPAATDDGNAVGAALYAHHVLLSGSGRSEMSTPTPLTNVALGPRRLPTHDLPQLLDKWQLRSHLHLTADAAATAAAAAVARGEIVGWFQERAELGPRALGHRSILCHPGLANMKARLNARVKFREGFRPFAASVLAERAHKWFDMPAPSSPFMLLVCPVWPAQRDTIGEVVHVDGTCRIQTVDADERTPFRLLLEAFEHETGLPMVLNTSFNLRGMPIVENPQDALDCLYGARLDRLFIGDVEVLAPDLTAMRPLRCHPRTADSAKPLVAATADTDIAQALLRCCDGATTLHTLATQHGFTPDLAVDTALDLRRQGWIQWDGIPSLQPPALPLPQYEPQAETE